MNEKKEKSRKLPWKKNKINTYTGLAHDEETSLTESAPKEDVKQVPVEHNGEALRIADTLDQPKGSGRVHIFFNKSSEKSKSKSQNERGEVHRPGTSGNTVPKDDTVSFENEKTGNSKKRAKKSLNEVFREEATQSVQGIADKTKEKKNEPKTAFLGKSKKANASPSEHNPRSLFGQFRTDTRATKTYTQLESQVHDCKDQVQDNIEKIVEKGPDLQNLQERADLLSENAIRFKKNTKEAYTCNMKSKRIIISIFVVLVIIVIVIVIAVLS
uniref:Uncharacterized protein LOC111119323 isoform X1 n=1 Tax=Crassostrea virginica TaxID=6565 RepID=A0A8B8CH05_CRAVI|nr:uncharacterized protein LOC111119323 isoform X1 [Crassostrea virginica]